VVLGRVDASGFDAVDPRTGQQRWNDAGATGAWTFRDAVLAVQCDKSECALANRAPADGATRWRVPLPGNVRARAGVNDGLLDLRSIDSTFDAAIAASPRPMPRYLGYLHDHRLQVIDTTIAKRVRDEDVPLDARSVMVGNRTVRAGATTRDGGCRYHVTGRDAASGAQVWRNDGYDLGTAGGAGCEPRRDPAGGGTAVIATRGDNRRVFMSAVDGRDLAVAGPDETILGTDGEYGLIRGPDGRKIRAVRLAQGGVTAWSQEAPPNARIGLTPFAVLVVDPDGGRIMALDPATGQVKLNLASTAVVLGVHSDGIVLGNGRTVGYIGFGAVA
jgi:outer membrane protein assembly factor BamB